jgi:hypothetical protein
MGLFGGLIKLFTWAGGFSRKNHRKGDD